MKSADLRPGMVFGRSTVLGPATPEYRDARRWMRVECWSCKGVREVSGSNLIAGKSKACATCSAKRRRFRMNSGFDAPSLDRVGVPQ